MSKTSVKSAEQSAFTRYATIITLCFGAIPLLAIPDFKWLGWMLLFVVLLSLVLRRRTRFSRDTLVLAGALVLLGIVPISTDINYSHMFIMGGILTLAVLAPWAITTYIFGESIVTFPFRLGRNWYKREVAYVLFAGIVAYLFIPFYLASTRSYLNWSAQLDLSHIVRLFIGTNALGIWDEIFFVGVCLAILRSHIQFVWANIAQALLWTAFLYKLGFRGWGPFVIFFFALSQGYIFLKTKSLLYIITVHLTIDLMLFLTLIHLHNPQYLRIFTTSPF